MMIWLASRTVTLSCLVVSARWSSSSRCATSTLTPRVLPHVAEDRGDVGPDLAGQRLDRLQDIVADADDEPHPVRAQRGLDRVGLAEVGRVVDEHGDDVVAEADRQPAADLQPGDVELLEHLGRRDEVLLERDEGMPVIEGEGRRDVGLPDLVLLHQHRLGADVADLCLGLGARDDLAARRGAGRGGSRTSRRACGRALQGLGGLGRRQHLLQARGVLGDSRLRGRGGIARPGCGARGTRGRGALARDGAARLRSCNARRGRKAPAERGDDRRRPSPSSRPVARRSPAPRHRRIRRPRPRREPRSPAHRRRRRAWEPPRRPPRHRRTPAPDRAPRLRGAAGRVVGRLVLAPVEQAHGVYRSNGKARATRGDHRGSPEVAPSPRRFSVTAGGPVRVLAGVAPEALTLIVE